MRTLLNTPAESETPQLPMKVSRHFRANTSRVLVRRANGEPYTTVSVPDDWLARATKFAGDVRVVRAALRRAAKQVLKHPPGNFSHLVRSKAMASLRGNYRPNQALGEAQAAEARLAADNNAVWSATT
jgi:hypothetical protein